MCGANLIKESFERGTLLQIADEGHCPICAGDLKVREGKIICIDGCGAFDKNGRRVE